jgi:TonB family protein
LKRKEYIIGLIGTLGVHVIILLILLLIFLKIPIQQQDKGIPVIFGDMEQSSENDNRSSGSAGAAEQHLVAQPQQEKTQNSNDVPDARDNFITQKESPSVTMAVSKNRKTVRQAISTRRVTDKKRDAHIDNPVSAAASNKVRSAFGRGNVLISRGDDRGGSGTKGSPTGTSKGFSGTEGHGSFSLNGRSLASALPRPSYNVQEEGTVCVSIIVSPNGRVMSVSINKRSNTMSGALRSAALNAARKARFNTIKNVNNQQGTITYYFKLK